MSTWQVFVNPTARREVDRLPGNFRQRMREAIRDLARDARPQASGPLDVAAIAGLDPAEEVRRFRMPPWRMIYTVNEADPELWVVRVVAIRKRPPYAYDDLARLLGVSGGG